MKWLALMLLAGVIIRHDTIYWLSDLSGMSPAGVFYVLGGLWEVLLCLGILALLVSHRGSWAWLARTACAIGIVEGLQIGVCRMMVSDIKALPKNTNLCDFATGLPIGSVVLALYILILCVGANRAFRAA